MNPIMWAYRVINAQECKIMCLEYDHTPCKHPAMTHGVTFKVKTRLNTYVMDRIPSHKERDRCSWLPTPNRRYWSLDLFGVLNCAVVTSGQLMSALRVASIGVWSSPTAQSLCIPSVIIICDLYLQRLCVSSIEAVWLFCQWGKWT